MTSIRVSRMFCMPDALRIERYKRAPDLGPRILFFSGGTALNKISRALKEYTHNSVHLVTPFDSGGSSAKLRTALGMPSIGDLRSRMMALADEAVTGHPEIYRLFGYRLSKKEKKRDLATKFDTIVRGQDKLIKDISNPMRHLIRSQLKHFQDAMPTDFDLRGANIGNLILAGGYLDNSRHLDPIVFLFSKLVSVCGTVRTIVNNNLHVGAELKDGHRIIGQHRLTGKETPPLTSPIQSLFLSADAENYVPAIVTLHRQIRKLITGADIICYPPGSFYTSIIANLIPKGVREAIHANGCPKVYIPNLADDPEQIGMNGDNALKVLLTYVSKTEQKKRGLDFILVDEKTNHQQSQFSETLLAEHGITLLRAKLIHKRSYPYYDPDLLISALLSLT